MGDATKHDAWAAGDSYEAYMGRWSRNIAVEFVRWLDIPKGQDWLELGCGTGALSSEVLLQCSPHHLICSDSSEGFINSAKQRINSELVQFQIASAEDIPVPDESRDCVVSALAINFMSDKSKALSEMKRVLKPNGTLGFYVWDYPGGGVGFMRAFWNAAVTCDPNASEFTEDRRFPYCTEKALSELVSDAGFTQIHSTALEVSSIFQSFDDLWMPFTLGAGPAPGYCANLSPEKREVLRMTLKNQLETSDDGSIPLKLRAWAVRAKA